MPDNLDLRVRLMNYMATRAEVADLRAGILGIGTDAKVASGMAERGFGGMHSGLKSMLGVVGIAGVAIGLKDLIRSGMTLQNNQAQLRGALVGAAGGGAAAFAKLNQQMKTLSTSGGFGWSQQLESLTLFLRQTRNIPQAMQAERAAVLLARGAHIDLATAQHAVAAGLGGNTWALKQYIHGIVPANKALIALTVQHRAYLEQLKLQEKFQGNTIASQEQYYNLVTQANARFAAQKRIATAADLGTGGKEIIDKITSAYGGSIERFNKQSQGKLSNFLHIWQNVMAEAGKALLPAFNTVIGALTSMGHWLDRNKWAIVALAGTTSTLAALWAGMKIVKGVMAMYNGIRMSVKIMGTGVKLLGLMGTEAEFSGMNIEALAGFWRGANKAEKEALLTSEAFEGVMAADVGLTEALGAAFMAVAVPLAIVTAIAAIGFGIYELIAHWKTVTHAVGDFAATVWRDMGAVWKTIEHVGSAIGGAFATAWNAAKHWTEGAINWIAKKVEWLFTNTPLGLLFQPAKTIVGVGSNLLSGNFAGAGRALLHGVSATAHAATFGLIGHTGGRVERRHFDTGGPVGTDTVPAWLSPGEYVINSSAASQIGYGTLSAINSGRYGGGQHITITPAPVTINLDGRRLAQAVVRYTVERAARGPSSIVGGSLMTGVGGPTHVYD